MKPRVLIIWVALLALAAGGYFYSQRRQASVEKVKDQESRLVTALADPLNVQTLEFNGTEAPKPMRVERRDAEHRWVLTTPVDYEADGMAVGRVIGSLLDARIKERVQPKGPLADFGLEPPRMAITLTDRQGAKSEVLLGDLSPSKEYLYAALPGAEEVLLLPASVRSEAVRTLFDLRSKSVLDYVVTDVKRVDFAAGDSSLTLTRQSAGADPKWTLPGQGEASSKAVDDLLYQIHGLQAVSILDEGINPARMGLDKPSQTITLTREDGSTLGLAVGGLTPGGEERYLRRLAGGPVLVVKNESLNRLKRQPKDLLERRVLIFERDQVSELTVQREGNELVFQKKDGVWRRSTPPGDEKNGEAGSLFLWDLQDLKWESILPPAEAKGLDKPSAVIILTLAAPAKTQGSAQTKTFKLTLGQPPDKAAGAAGLMAAKVEGDSRIFGIIPSFAKNIPALDEKPVPPASPGGAK